jgi:uncharacterized protein with GYD domain
MSTYFILLNKPQNSDDESTLTLDEARFTALLKKTGIQIFDVYMVTGKFDLLLICEASDIRPIRVLLAELRGWVTTSMLASKHVGRFGMTEEVRRTNWVNPRQTAAALKIVSKPHDRPTKNPLR